VPLLRPATIAIHNHRYVPRQTRQIQPLEQLGLFRSYRPQRL